jgi:hypothetical protein
MTINLDDRWEPQRDRWGRPLIVPPDGGKPVGYTRATTVAKTLDDEGSLIKWTQRMTAAGLARRSDLLALVSSRLTADGDIPEQHKAEVQRLCDEAKEHGGGSRAANLGTALHALTEQVDLGDNPTIPTNFQPDIDAYRRAVEPFQVLAVEQFVVLDDHQIAGTLDRLWQLPDGRIVIADLKTGQNLDYSWRSIAVQLAIYAAGTRYRDGQRSPLHCDGVNPDIGIVIHLPIGQARCDLYQVDLRAGTVALAHSMWARRWRTRRDLHTTFVVPADVTFQREPEPAPTTASNRPSHLQGPVPGRHQLVDRIRTISQHPNGRAWLRLHWPADIPTLKQSDRHNPHELAIIAALAADAERDLNLPFNQHDIGDVATPEPSATTPRATKPEWARPSDGRRLSDNATTQLRADINSVEEPALTLVKRWLADAQAHGRPVVINRQHTERSRAVIGAMVAVARYAATDHDLIPILLAATLNADPFTFPCNTPGAGFATLTRSQADLLRRLAEQAVEQPGTEIPVTFADNGTPRLVLDAA